MTNLEIAWTLTEMADLLELKGEAPYKVRAYRRAAGNIKNLEEEVSNFYTHGTLEKIPGIGKNLAAKISELLRTGRSTFLEDLRKEVPPGLRKMLVIPGLGTRSVYQIYMHLGVQTLAELEKAAKNKQIRKLPGMGTKTELAILRGIRMLKEEQDKIPLGVALPLALMLKDQLLAIQGVKQVEIAGSVRRGCEMVGDIDLVAKVTPDNQVAAVMSGHPQVKEVLANEPERLALLSNLGFKVEIIMVGSEEFASTLLYATGSAAHRQKLLQLVAEQGKTARDIGFSTPRWLAEESKVLTGNHEDIKQKDKNKTKVIKNPGLNEEEVFYERLGLPYIVPELREDRGEIEAAQKGELPQLVSLDHIVGDLHMHTNYSDGAEDIKRMAMAARERGYRYIAITDHSRSLVVARGLSIEQIKAQRAEIEQLNQELEDITILAGIEVDILKDGSLDYEDEILKEFDLVIASVHSGFSLEQDRMMARVEKALRHPYVDILGHPTGRILGRRRPYAVDVKRIIELAAETGTILEINASPDRLDLNDNYVRLAKDYGVPIAINTDAHDLKRMGEMEYGVITARRGWLEPKDVVNTWDLDKLLARLKRNR